MRILQLSLTADDGTPQRLGRELRAAGLDSTVAIICDGEFPRDAAHEHVDPTWGSLKRLIHWADILQVHGLAAYQLFQKELRGRTFVVHIRNHEEHEKGFQPRFPHVVSTPALLQQFPEAACIPDLISPADLPSSPPLDPARVRIFLNPSRLEAQEVSFFTQVIDRMNQHLVSPLECVTTEPTATRSTLIEMRSSCHIHIDSLRSCCNLDSYESLAQGLVTMNGVTRAYMDQLKDLLGATPPFVTAGSLSDAGRLLLGLIQEALNQPLRFEQRRVEGKDFVERYYSPRSLIGRWREVYGSLNDSPPAGRAVRDSRVQPTV